MIPLCEAPISRGVSESEALGSAAFLFGAGHHALEQIAAALALDVDGLRERIRARALAARPGHCPQAGPAERNGN